MSTANSPAWNAALTVSQEAVDLRRELAAVNRDAYLPDLAGSVNNHAVRLAEVGRRGEAVTVSEEAVDLYRELAAVNRDAYLPNLAAALLIYALVRKHLEEADKSEAIRAAAEARSLFSQLATSMPDAFQDKANQAGQLVRELGEDPDEESG